MCAEILNVVMFVFESFLVICSCKGVCLLHILSTVLYMQKTLSTYWLGGAATLAREHSESLHMDSAVAKDMN